MKAIDQMDTRKLTILLIEDNPADTRLVRELLDEEKSVRFEVAHVAELEKGLDRLSRGNIDAVLLDLTLPDSQGIETFYQVINHSPDVPIVVLTGLKDDSLAVEMIRAGAQDFLVKGSINYCVLYQTLEHAMERKLVERMNLSKKADEPAKSAPDQLLALLSYELKKPIAGVLKAISDLSLDLTTSASFLPTLAMFRSFVERQKRLIDDTLEYSRVSTQCEAFRATDLEIILEHVLINLRPLIAQTGAIITHEPMPILWADGIQLKRLFTNLIANALEFHGEAPPLVHITAQQHGATHIFSVRDNGIGFDPVESERIFTIFQRLYDDHDPSTGAGLAICRKIVERHAGQIWAQSEPGQGSCFFVTIPTSRNRD
jgi:signal transduction histidine kinase